MLHHEEGHYSYNLFHIKHSQSGWGDGGVLGEIWHHNRDNWSSYRMTQILASTTDQPSTDKGTLLTHYASISPFVKDHMSRIGAVGPSWTSELVSAINLFAFLQQLFQMSKVKKPKLVIWITSFQ